MKKIIHFDTTCNNHMMVQRIKRATSKGETRLDEIGIAIEGGFDALPIDEAKKFIKAIEELIHDAEEEAKTPEFSKQ